MMLQISIIKRQGVMNFEYKIVSGSNIPTPDARWIIDVRLISNPIKRILTEFHLNLVTNNFLRCT